MLIQVYYNTPGKLAVIYSSWQGSEASGTLSRVYRWKKEEVR